MLSRPVALPMESLLIWSAGVREVEDGLGRRVIVIIFRAGKCEVGVGGGISYEGLIVI